MNRSTTKKAVSLLIPVSLLCFANARAGDISSEENDAISKHFEHAQLPGRTTAALPVSAAAATPSIDLSSFSKQERELLEKNQVVIGTLDHNGHKRVRARVKIAAAPHVVWETVHEERKTDPDLAYSKVLETNGHTSTLEQKFQLIPVVGTAICEMKNVEIPGHRIDYWLTKSERFKALEGSWVITALREGGTILELSSYIDMGLPIPRTMQDMVTGKKLERRLQNIRKMAEQAHPHSVARKPEAGIQ